MKDLILMLSTFAVFVFGFFIIKNVDAFIEENQRLIALESRNNSCHIQISAETPMMINSIASVLESCSAMNPYIEFCLSSGNANLLLKKLIEGSTDIVLLSEGGADDVNEQFKCVKIPYREVQLIDQRLGLSVENLDTNDWIYIVWNKTIISKNRDRVIFALENWQM